MMSRPAAPQLFGAFPLLMAFSLAGTTGCDDVGELVNVTQTPTEVAVSPADFLGEVRCGPEQGAMKSYVVTLSAYDDVDDTIPFVLGASLPTPCTYPAGFRTVVVSGKLYTAEIDGYDVPATTLEPFGGVSSGSRQMHDVQTGASVYPRWTTRCGDGAADATMADTNSLQFVSSCEPLDDKAPSPTRLAVAPTLVLGDEPCLVAPTFDLLADYGALEDQYGIACDAAPQLFDAVGGSEYRLYARANTDGGSIGRECWALAQSGETIEPICSPLSATGYIRLNLADLATGTNPSCPVGAYYDVLGAGGLLNSVPAACTEQLLIGPFPPDIHVFSLVVYDADGALIDDGLTCGAQVLAGKTVTGLCSP